MEREHLLIRDQLMKDHAEQIDKMREGHGKQYTTFKETIAQLEAANGEMEKERELWTNERELWANEKQCIQEEIRELRDNFSSSLVERDEMLKREREEVEVSRVEMLERF